MKFIMLELCLVLGMLLGGFAVYSLAADSSLVGDADLPPVGKSKQICVPTGKGDFKCFVVKDNTPPELKCPSCP